MQLFRIGETSGKKQQVAVGLRRLSSGLVAFALVAAISPVVDFSSVAIASTVTSGSCTSTVDNATGVTMSVAGNGDCVVAFATAQTAGATSQISAQRSWTVPADVTSLKILVVGGGGGGASNDVNSAGGGGGGGVVVISGYAVTPGAAITITTGAGGAGKTGCSPVNGNGYSGSDSKFGVLIAKGGGGGSGCSAQTQSGGSGGGQVLVGVAATTQASLGTASNGWNISAYGSAGGTGNNSENASGGGGGATGAGVGPSSNSVAGRGGEGISNQFRSDSSVIYGSGGGGAGTTPGAAGTNAGKGNGDATTGGGVGKHGVDETGSGGGGVGRNVTSGEGGSGIVVVRYSLMSAPVATAATVLSGNTYVGETLSATSGSWTGTPNIFTYSYQWMRQSAIGQNFTDITGATSSSYTIVSDDAGYRLKAVITSSNGVSPDSSIQTTTTAAVTEVPPVNTASPVVTGTTQTGQTLSVSEGSWSATPTSYLYQWTRSTASSGTYATISGATASTYLIDAGDVGYYIKGTVAAVRNGATSSYASTSATVQTIDLSPVNAAAPIISGTAKTAQTLSISSGSWNNRPTSYLYQWMRSATSDGTYVAISGATSSTYVVVTGDVGYFIKGSVAGVNTGGTSSYASSVATAQVIDVAPTNSLVPSVTGTAQTTQTLSVSTGSWNNRPTSYLYQWRRSATSGGTYVAISGAASSTYVVVAGDVGYFIKGYVAGVNTGGTSSYASSVATAQVVDVAPTNSLVPSVTGTAQTGQTLSVSTGSWSDRPTSYLYQWKRSVSVDGTYENIANSTTSTYVVVTGDVGYFIKGYVAGVNTGGASSYASSSATAQVIDISPTNSAGPVISGIAQTGQTLSVTNGAWNNRPTSYSYQWKRSLSSDGTYSNIAGAESNTYVVDSGDVGYFIKAFVTASNTGGPSSELSAATIAVKDLVSVNSVVPAITGTAQTGQTLSVSNGSWNNRPTSFTYQWLRSATSGGSYEVIANATSATYVVVAGDVGYFIKGSVSGVNSGGQSTYSLSPASSQVIDIVPVYSGPPAITGTAQTGQTLSVSDGSWDNHPTSFRYQWLRSATSGGSYEVIANATSATYVVVAGDVGYFIKAAVTGENTGGAAAASAGSAATAIVIDVIPRATGRPVITGTAQTGKMLSVSDGSWDNRPTSFRYQWLRSATSGGSYEVIANSTFATYIVVAGDVGYFIKGSVAGLNTGGESLYSASVPTVQMIDIAPVYSGPPAITGTAQTGQTLSVSDGSWNNRPTSFRYQWLRSATSGGSYEVIANATSATYVIAAGDIGYFIKATVAGENTGGVATASALSGATAATIDVAPISSVAPIIAGTSQTGQTLSVSNGSWSNRPTSFRYQWKRSTLVDGTYVNIPGAEANTYVVVAGDVGYFIKAEVTSSNTGGPTAEVSVATVRTIDIAPILSVAPSITGTAQTGQTLSVSNGSWSNRPTSHLYQWKRSISSDGSYIEIADATASTYVVTAGDVGYFITALVTGVNTGGSSLVAARAAPTAITIDIAPVSSTVPSISGVVQNGRTISVSNGTWANRPTVYAYQWRRSLNFGSGFADINGANSSTYVLDEGDVGYFFKASVIASNTGGSSGVAWSNTTVAVLDIAPINVSLPVAAGTGQVDQTLTSTNGSWRSSPTSYSYQWKRSATSGGQFINIGGETSSSYVVTPDDVGQYIKVAVIATNDIGSSVAILSVARGPIIDVIAINVTLPIVSGTLQNGEEVSASSGQWTSSPASYSYQWKRSANASGPFVNIAGETNNTLDLTDNDINQFIKVFVVAINSGGSSAPVASAGTNAIADMPTVPAPTVSQLSIRALSDGFTFQISNFSSTYIYGLTSTSGTTSMNDTGLSTVSGLTAGTSASVTVRASRGGYRSASLVVVGTTTAPPVTTTTTTTPPTVTTAPSVGSSVSTTTTTTTTTTTMTVAPAPSTAPTAAISATVTSTSTTVAVVSGVNQGQRQQSSATTPSQKREDVSTTSTTIARQVKAPVVGQVLPGDGIATIGGVIVKSVITRVDNQVVVTSGGISAAVGVLNPDGSVAPLDNEGNVRVKPGQLFKLELKGFVIGTEVEVWLFSSPHRLGTVITGADGKVRATFELPSDLEGGQHRLAFVGKGPGGKRATIVIGIVAGAAPKSISSMKILIAIPLLMAIFFGLMLPGVLKRRRRRSTNI